MVVHACHSSIRRLKWQNWWFQASLSYTKRSCLINKTGKWPYVDILITNISLLDSALRAWSSFAAEVSWCLSTDHTGACTELTLFFLPRDSLSASSSWRSSTLLASCRFRNVRLSISCCSFLNDWSFIFSCSYIKAKQFLTFCLALSPYSTNIKSNPLASGTEYVIYVYYFRYVLTILHKNIFQPNQYIHK